MHGAVEAKTDPAASEQQLRATGLRRNMQAPDWRN
jgi:hypothetical protein